ncbi:polynucleotide kinase [Serratia phage 92A1]|nr:polynucleotide kinase [Serratia phage 92A1]
MKYKKTVILTVGAPGSGKTTWAEEFVRKQPGAINLNRDSFRASLFAREPFKRPTKYQEQCVTDAQFAAAEALLAKDTTRYVVISDTNLNPSTVQRWKQLTEKLKVNFQEQFFDVDFEELKRRNARRGNASVPSAVVRDFYLKMSKRMRHYVYEPDVTLPKAIIYDLDGTLAIHDGRSPYDLELLSTDKPNYMVIEHLKAMQRQGFVIITASGRESGTSKEPSKYYDGTLKWLSDNGVNSDLHIQRTQGDSRPDWIVKMELFKNQIASKYQVVLCVDDRDQVIDMWRSIGLEAWQVNYGDF